jgi:osmoprotectant transport system substrate-binding protein
MIRSSRKSFLAALAGLTFVLAACGGGGSSSSGGGGTLNIAFKNFSENSIMATMTKVLLEKHNYTVNLKEIAGNASIRQGLETKQYDGYWEYLGTGLVDVNNITDPSIIGDPSKAVSKLNQLDSAKGIMWLDPASKFNDPDVLVIKSSDTGKYGSTMTQLATYLRANANTKLCLQSEFLTRPAGLPALTKVYGFPSKDQLQVTTEKESIALQDVAAHPDRCEVAQGFGTDANIAALNLVIVKDDKKALPSDSLSLTMLKSVVDAHSDLKDLVKKITDVFTTQDSIDLQKKIDVDKKDEVVVCTDYLKSKGII